MLLWTIWYVSQSVDSSISLAIAPLLMIFSPQFFFFLSFAPLLFCLADSKLHLSTESSSDNSFPFLWYNVYSILTVFSSSSCQACQPHHLLFCSCSYATARRHIEGRNICFFRLWQQRTVLWLWLWWQWRWFCSQYMLMVGGKGGTASSSLVASAATAILLPLQSSSLLIAALFCLVGVFQCANPPALYMLVCLKLFPFQPLTLSGYLDSGHTLLWAAWSGGSNQALA